MRAAMLDDRRSDRDKDRQKLLTWKQIMEFRTTMTIENEGGGNLTVQDGGAPFPVVGERRRKRTSRTAVHDGGCPCRRR